MKKLALCALLVCAALVGCGDEKKPTASASGSTAASS